MNILVHNLPGAYVDVVTLDDFLRRNFPCGCSLSSRSLEAHLYGFSVAEIKRARRVSSTSGFYLPYGFKSRLAQPRKACASCEATAEAIWRNRAENAIT